MKISKVRFRTARLFSKYRDNVSFLFRGDYVKVIKYYVVFSTRTKFNIYFLLSNSMIITKENKKTKGVQEI